ncbi:hypothetical protein KKH27_05620 [bacterium]|nr:hypothetical protein [bacterium]MBU1984405.1 hypothetical protein [bacterium]
MPGCCAQDTETSAASPTVPDGRAGKTTFLPAAWREAAIFGALWGAIELTIGPFLYMTRIPLKGVVLSGMAVGLLVASQMLIRRPWFPLRAALICVAIRALAPDGMRPGLMFALLFQGFEVSLYFLLFRSPLLVGIAAGFTAAVASQIQSFVDKLFKYGLNFWELFVALLEKAQSLLHLNVGSEWLVIGLFLTIVGIVGALEGVLGWRLGQTALNIRRERERASP